MTLSKFFVAPRNGQGGAKKSKSFFRKIIQKMEKSWTAAGTIIAQNRFLWKIFGHVSDGKGVGCTVPRSRPMVGRCPKYIFGKFRSIGKIQTFYSGNI